MYWLSLSHPRRFYVQTYVFEELQKGPHIRDVSERYAEVIFALHESVAKSVAIVVVQSIDEPFLSHFTARMPCPFQMGILVYELT